MNPFICGKFVDGRESYPTYALVDKETREAHGRSQYFAKYFCDAEGTWHVLDFSHSPRRPVPVADQLLIERLERIRTRA